MVCLLFFFWLRNASLVKVIGKSDFGWIAFTHFPLLNAYYKEGSKKSQGILLAFRSYILTGEPELLLYLMFFLAS